MIAPKTGLLPRGQAGTQAAMLSLNINRNMFQMRAEKDRGWEIGNDSYKLEGKYDLEYTSLDFKDINAWKNEFLNVDTSIENEEFLLRLQVRYKHTVILSEGVYRESKVDRILENMLKNVDALETYPSGTEKKGPALNEAKINSIARNFVFRRNYSNAKNLMLFRMQRADFKEKELQDGLVLANNWLQQAVQMLNLREAKNTKYYPWQQKFANLLDIPPDEVPHSKREVYLLISKGNMGKTWLAKLFCAKNHATSTIIPNSEMKDMSYVLSKVSPMNTCIFVQQTMDTEKLEATFLEGVKDQFVMSKKYHSKMVWLMNNHCVAVTNTEPDYTSLSIDRWRVFEVLNTTDGKVDVFERKHPKETINKERNNCNLHGLLRFAEQYWQKKSGKDIKISPVAQYIAPNKVMIANGSNNSKLNKSSAPVNLPIPILHKPDDCRSQERAIYVDPAITNHHLTTYSQQAHRSLIPLIPESGNIRVNETGDSSDEFQSPVKAASGNINNNSAVNVNVSQSKCSRSFLSSAIRNRNIMTTKGERLDYNNLLDNNYKMKGQSPSMAQLDTLLVRDNFIFNLANSIKERTGKKGNQILQALINIRRRYLTSKY